jgi:ribosomal protein L11 methyltransferase
VGGKRFRTSIRQTWEPSHWSRTCRTLYPVCPPAADAHMPWLQISFDVARDQAEILEAALENAGALAVTLGDAGDDPQLEPPPGATPLWSGVRLTALFADDLEARGNLATLATALAPLALTPPIIEEIADRAWERVWLDDFAPTRFGRRLWVCPRGQRPESAEAGTDPVILELDPGLAFGTGHHATTALCLEWLDGVDLVGKTVLDYGCGSGILAIAALRLGASRALAVDHDPQALEATRDNAAENGVTDRLQVFYPQELHPMQADVLVANILAGPLVELAPRLTALVAPGGALALSGVLVGQAAEVATAYADGFDLEPTRIREDWTLITGRRKQPCP